MHPAEFLNDRQCNLSTNSQAGSYAGPEVPIKQVNLCRKVDAIFPRTTR